MKRRSRGEQMLAAAGVAAPVSAPKPDKPTHMESAESEDRSPPAKRARPSRGSPAQTGQQLRLEPGSPELSNGGVNLSAELELLASMFDALRTGRMMLKRRSERVTYNNVRQVVENMTKREFRVEHLAQMKYLQPDAFDWQYIRMPSATNNLQLETQLLLTFDRPASSGADGGGSVGKYSGTAEVAEFRAQLERYVRETPLDPATGKLPPIPQAPLPPRPTASGMGPSRSGSLPPCGSASPATIAGLGGGAPSGLLKAASCPLGLLPDALAAGDMAGSLSSPGGSRQSAASPSMTRSRSRLGLPPAVPPTSLTPIPEGNTPTRPNSSARQRGPGDNDDMVVEDVVGVYAGQQRQLAGEEEAAALELTRREKSVVTEQPSARGRGFGCDGGAATPQSKGPRLASAQSTPTSHRQPGPGGKNDARLARLHSMLSPAALQKILQTEAAQAAKTPEAKRRAELRRAVQLLPHGHELVRLIFGIQGPTVKPLTQVALAMCERSTQRQGLTSREASNTLVALARAVPEFLRIEEPRVMADGSARPRSVVISRAANINAVAAKLKALAADPDAAVQSVFERSLAAAVTAAIPSPTRSDGVRPAAAPESPGHLKPRALAMALDDGAAAAGSSQSGCGGNALEAHGSSAAAAQPSACRASGAVGQSEQVPPTPSSRRRPPGLPLPPPSPSLHRGAQTPTRDQVLRSSAEQNMGTAMAGAVPAQASLKPLAAHIHNGGVELLQKLCRTGGPTAEQGAGRRSETAGGDAEGGAWRGPEGEREGLEAPEASRRTPGRVAIGGRTPGRTAVQEAMLNSIRRSSAKRSCRQMLEEDGGKGVLEVDAEEHPMPRRLEDLLGD